MIRFLLPAICVVAVLPGCVRRTLTINTEPPGALLWLNGREVGRTPIDVDFLYYGDYDIELVKEGFEPLVTNRRANAPWWDNMPLDFFAEITPGETKSQITWQFTLVPRNDDPNALIE